MSKFIITNFEDYLYENSQNFITVYHGTKPKFVNNIKNNGLEDKTSTPYNQGWYMVSTDFESALYHADSDDNRDFVYVFEFKIPILENNHKWLGYPYLWKGTEINNNSMWFALMKKIPKKFITTIHKITYDEWFKQKQKGF